MSAIQQDMWSPTAEQRFRAWTQTPGGRAMLHRAYRVTAGFAKRFLRTGQTVSIDYVWHILRYRLAGILGELKRRGVTLPPEAGYRLNNDFTAYLARHIVAHRPEWQGLFELREVGRERAARKITVVEFGRAPGRKEQAT